MPSNPAPTNQCYGVPCDPLTGCNRRLRVMRGQFLIHQVLYFEHVHVADEKQDIHQLVYRAPVATRYDRDSEVIVGAGLSFDERSRARCSALSCQ
ncbi:hypothetical protein LMG28614_00325 [Paraburkholderia ultramafica]|uniref:Uncharacterized protein n=1 Tax=Paraburkholderia ultramafica TaxID=1544867 RepID=A0A6S7AT43_9BURK|nr:hypothetical protein [Paraburkholderia ultramafica]CAB3776975.1 hypothetical protein LMG28614_00325 [Paraburkholderia ultramafica]